MQTSIKRIKYSFQELEEDRALLQRRVDEQLQQIAELKSMLDGLKVTSQDTAAYDQVDNEIQRLNVHLESTQSDVDAKNKEVGTNHRYNYYYTYLLCQTMDLSIIFPIFLWSSDSVYTQAIYFVFLPNIFHSREAQKNLGNSFNRWNTVRYTGAFQFLLATTCERGRGVIH